MSPRRALHASWLLLLCALSCSWFVDPLDGVLLCERVEIDGVVNNVCPSGLECNVDEGKCGPICRRDVPDVCGDGLDNDCDGNTDEIDPEGRDTCGDDANNDCDSETDEGSDNDGDGFFWCGRTSGTGPANIDCDDKFKDDFPGAPELCDGRDNDCDERIDEAPADKPLCEPGSVCLQRCIKPSCITEGGVGLTCGPDQRCDVATGACISKQCADVTCGAEEFCDEASKTCRPVSRVKRENNEPCVSDTDCLSDSCIDAASLRLASGMRVCGQACCSDADCKKEGQRCFASGTGARSCMPVGRLPPVAQRECTTDAMCRGSEVCALSRNQDLAPPVFTMRDNVITSACAASTPLPLKTGERCTYYTQCASRACVSNVLFGNVCSSPCGSSPDCKTLSDAVKQAGGMGAYCRYVDVALGEDMVDYAALCVVQRMGDTGPGVYGAPCTRGNECLEGGCVGATATATGRCTPTCCNDTQCSNREDGTPIHCVPFAFGERYEMRCDI